MSFEQRFEIGEWYELVEKRLTGYPSWSNDLRDWFLSSLHCSKNFKFDASIRNRSCSRPHEGRSPCQSSDGKKTEVSAMGLGGNPGQVPFPDSSGGSIFGGRGEFSVALSFPQPCLWSSMPFSLVDVLPVTTERMKRPTLPENLQQNRERSRKLKSLKKTFHRGYTYLFIGRCPNWASLFLRNTKTFSRWLRQNHWCKAYLIAALLSFNDPSVNQELVDLFHWWGLKT